MRTEDLIEALALETPPAPADLLVRRLAMAAGLGALATLAVLLAWLGLRPDLHLAVRGGFFWLKLAYSAAFALAGAALVDRYGRPGGQGRWRWLLVVGPIMVLALIAVAASHGQGMAGMRRDMMGHSWRLCPWRILALAIPTFAGALWSFRRLAPTRLGLAGFAAGLFAGGVSASVYGLACDEKTALFVVTWYTLGILACGGIGALLGPRLLRW
jgi:hypothetical protein